MNDQAHISTKDKATEIIDRYTSAVIEAQHKLANDANRHLVQRLRDDLIDRLVNGLGYRQ